MAFDKIKQSQPLVVKLLENSLKKDRLSHAYLFEGEKGTKKFETAIYFAQMLLCTEENKPCGVCKNCKRIASHIHPNVYVIEPDRGSIRKQQIIDLQVEFSKTSIEPGPKVYIIRDIETINVSAANSLLKFLEEPFPNIHAILTTANIHRILPTIISRSQIVQFTSLSKDVVRDELLENGFDDETARIISNLTNSTSDAEDIATSENYLEIIEIVKEVYRLQHTKEEPLLIYFNENSSIIYQEKELSHLFLSCLIIYQKDLINHKVGDYENIVFQDELETIQALTRDKTKNRLIDELESMLSLKSRLNNYINERLAYDNLLLNLERR